MADRLAVLLDQNVPRAVADGFKRQCVIQPVSEDQVDSKADLAIKFPDRKVFGEFCITVRNDDVPFSLAGFQVVVLSRKHYRNLPIRSRQFIETHPPIEVSTTRSEKRRALPDKKETETLLRRFSKKR